jgi:hypothetical protein
MVKTTEAMEALPNRLLYNRRLASNLINFVRTNVSRVRAAAGRGDDDSTVARLEELLPHSAAPSTVREFDAATIVPMFGYRDVMHYYRDASSGRLLGDVGIPFLMLNALDDPVCAASGIPVDTVLGNSNVRRILRDDAPCRAVCRWCGGASLMCRRSLRASRTKEGMWHGVRARGPLELRGTTASCATTSKLSHDPVGWRLPVVCSSSDRE